MQKGTVKINGKYYHVDNIRIDGKPINSYHGKIENPIRYEDCVEIKVELNKDQWRKFYEQLEDFCKDED